MLSKRYKSTKLTTDDRNTILRPCEEHKNMSFHIFICKYVLEKSKMIYQFLQVYVILLI